MKVQSANGSPNNSQYDYNYPMFVFSRSKSIDHQTSNEEIPESSYKLLHQQLRQMKQNDVTIGATSNSNTGGADDDDNDETEEFVII